MAVLTAKFTTKSDHPIDLEAAKKAFKGMRTVFDHSNPQENAICTQLITLAAKKEKSLSIPLKQADFKLKGLPTDEDERSGEYKMTIKVDDTEIATNTVWINRSTKAVSIGITAANSSEKAQAILEKNKDKIAGLVLKKGDGQHPEDFKWALDGDSGSLPLVEHTKGKGGKNEKAALTALKKALKKALFI